MVGPIQGNNTPLVQSASSASSTFGTNSLNAKIFEDTLASLAAGNKGIIIVAANNPQLSRPSLFSYMQAVSLASSTNQSLSYTAGTDINRVSASFFRDMVFNADNLQKLLNLLLTIQNQTQQAVQNANAQINAENPQIAQYNSNVANDNSQSHTINTAATTFNAAYALFQQQTQQFNNGTITAAQFAQDQTIFNTAQSTYNAAVTSYNNYLATRNPQITAYNASANNYNTQIIAINNSINVINAERASVGLPPIPLLTPITTNINTLNLAASSPPSPAPVITPVNPSTLSVINPYAQPQPSDLVASIYNSLSQLGMVVVNQTKKGLQQIGTVRTFADFYLRTKTAINGLPPSFKSQMAVSKATTTGVGSNSGLGAIASALDPVIVNRLFNQGAQNALFQKTVAPVLKPGTINATLLATSTTLANTSINTASQILSMQQNSIQGISNNNGADETTIDKAFAFGLIRNILDFVSSNVLPEALQSYVSPDEVNNPNFSLAVNNLSSSINLSLIGQALSLLSSKLGLPGLGAQILGLAGVSSTSLFNITGNGISFSDFAFNPFTSGFVAQTLSSQLANSIGGSNGLSASATQQLQGNLQNAFNFASNNSSPLAGSGQFFSNLAQGLQNNGVTGDLANSALTAATGAFFEPAFTSRIDFRNNLQQSLVGQGFSSDDALQISSSIADVSPSSTAEELLNANTIDSSLLVANLAFNISRSGGIVTASSIASQVVGAALANTQEIAEATLRDNLVYNLKAQGIKEDAARHIVAATTIPSSSKSSPLTSAVFTSQMTQGQLHDELTASIKGVFSPLIGNQQAILQAQQLADSLVGPANANVKEIKANANPLSLVSTIHQTLTAVKNQNDQTSFNAAVNDFRDYLQPSTDLYTHLQQLNNPGDVYLRVDNLLNAPQGATGPVKMGGGGLNPPLEVQV
jgi:hypothetical protein